MRYQKLLILPLMVFTLFSCKDDGPMNEGSILDIKNWATTESITALEGLGFIIHEGDNPPNIEGEFALKVRTLQNTNVPGDFSIGSTFNELRMTFSNQDNNNLILNFVAKEYNSSGDPTSTSIQANDFETNSYISGSGNSFSAFFKVVESKDDNEAIILYGITGELTEEGFVSCQQSLMMLDDSGSDPGIFIKNNEGRIFIDQDGTVTKL